MQTILCAMWHKDLCQIFLHSASRLRILVVHASLYSWACDVVQAFGSTADSVLDIFGKQHNLVWTCVLAHLTYFACTLQIQAMLAAQ